MATTDATEAKDVIQIYQVTTTEDGNETETLVDNIGTVSFINGGTGFEIRNMNLNKERSYRVKFKGKQIPLGDSLNDNAGSIVTEISNKASIIYLEKTSESTGDTEGDGSDTTNSTLDENTGVEEPNTNATTDENTVVQTPEENDTASGDTSENTGTVGEELTIDTISQGTSKGNTVSYTERITNTVETDETHLYLEIEKEIPVDDPSQTFLFKVERFDSQADAEKTGAQPKDVFYTTINCTSVTVTTATTTTTYTGSRLIQVDERGYYRVTEVTDWSETDYDFDQVSNSEVSIENYPSKTTTASGKLQTVLLAPLQEGITIQTVGEEKTQLPVAEFTLPRMMYEDSMAFPTAMGSLADDTYPTVHFVDKESIYAYLSAQAYAENTFNIFTDIAGE
jgi:hypothetical protein